MLIKKLSQVVVYIITHISLLVSILILNCVFSPLAFALDFNQISQVYFFGDSLTDSGFNDLWSQPTSLPTSKAPTFTTFDGYVWSQYISRDIKGFTLPIYPGPTPPDTITNNTIYPVTGFVSGMLAGINYAAAGSTTNSAGVNEFWAPSLHQQIAYFLSTVGQTIDPNALYFIWSGANDILQLLFNAPPIPTELQLLTAANTAATNIANEVALLSAHGAKRIVILSLPNMGYTPLINGIATTYNIPTLPASIKTISFTFNSMLNQQLGRVIAQYGTKILYFNVYQLLENVIQATQAGKPYVIAGQSFLFANYTDPACADVLTAIYCPSTAPNNYIFADSLHPSGMTHRVLSLAIESEIQNWK